MRIGLEVHVALPTKSKLYCSCRTYTEEPNSSICPICMGMPGSKPKLNREALRLGLAVAFALNCGIGGKTSFVRKVYFYPDLPKGYQISQLYNAVGQKGFLETEGKRIRIRRVQLEEDPAKIIRGEDYTLLDFNRSGTPLLEIVTEPDIESEEELRNFNAELRSVLYYLGIDIDKEMKADLNISLSESRVEVKNITGIKNLIDAARYEIERQSALLARGAEPKVETRSYIPESMRTEHSREKETDEEYGYIFEPDLTFYSTNMEFPKPVFAGKLAREYAERYNASEKTLRGIIAYDRDALGLLTATAGRHSMQDIIASLELLKKYKAHMSVERFTRLIGRVEGKKEVGKEEIKAISEGKRVELAKRVSEEKIAKAIKAMLDSNPKLMEEMEKNPKSINMIIGRVSRETGASPRVVAEVAKRKVSHYRRKR